MKITLPLSFLPQLLVPDCILWSFMLSLLYCILMLNCNIQHTPVSLFYSSSAGTKTMIRWTGQSTSILVPCSFLYATLAFRILPSPLGCTLTTKAFFHCPLSAFASWTNTKSPTTSFLLSVCHFLWTTRFGKTSQIHLLQKVLIALCVKLNLLHEFVSTSNRTGGTSGDDLPRSKSLGDR